MSSPVEKPAASALACSPVEERHIDYILEEEFSVNPDFLRFFLEEATLSSAVKDRIVPCAEGVFSSAARSVTTSDGETDVLVRYVALQRELPVAILIENKIRASFQPDQAARYRLRGESGKNHDWSQYWTCLVAHKGYSADDGDFDAVVTLDALFRYFDSKTDERSRFRARVVQQTIAKFETTGIQRVDAGTTRFRAMYADECSKRLQSERWVYDKARAAWWDDTWFFFCGSGWPKGVQIRHQTRTGNIDLILPASDPAVLAGLAKIANSRLPRTTASCVETVAIGKRSHAIRIQVPKVVNFSIDAEPPEFEEFFAAIEFLRAVYENSSVPPEALSTSGVQATPPEDKELSALRSMLLGFMRSTVTSLGTQMPYPLPDLQRLTLSTPQEDRFFTSPGLMGGFSLELCCDEKHGPYIISEYSSRQWGSHAVRHKITSTEVVVL